MPKSPSPSVAPRFSPWTASSARPSRSKSPRSPQAQPLKLRRSLTPPTSDRFLTPSPPLSTSGATTGDSSLDLPRGTHPVRRHADRRRDHGCDPDPPARTCSGSPPRRAELDSAGRGGRGSAHGRVLLETLLESFREPNSTHPIAGAGSRDGARSPDIDEVFLIPLPQARDGLSNPGKMAVVDFSAAFAQAHPSGIEPETLTLLSIIGTLHANLPAITQVRFLVDGQPHDTLSGHADLTRVYLASNTGSGGGQ